MLGSPYLSHSSSVWTGCSVLTMLQTVFLFECLCHMICIILLSARCDLFVVLIKEYSSPEPIPCIWGIILPPGNFFFFFGWCFFPFAPQAVTSLTFILPQEKNRQKKWTCLCQIFSLLSLSSTGFGAPNIPPFLWCSISTVVTLPLRFKAVSAYLGCLYTVPGHVTNSAALGSCIFLRNIWILFPEPE